MNQFIKNTLFFSAPVLLFIVIMEIFLRNIPNDYSYKKNYLDHNSNQIETLFLGSSHALYAVNPEFIHGNSFNAAHVAQSLDYDLGILKKYEKQMNKLIYLVIPIDYFSLFNRLETGVEHWRIKNYNIYYGLNRSQNLVDNLEILNGKWSENIRRLLQFLIQNKSVIGCNQFGWGKRNSEDTKDLITTARAAAQRHAKKDKSFFKENVAIVHEIIALAKAKNVEVIFYTSPAYKTYTSLLNKEQLQITIATTKKMVSLNSHVQYYNFLNDTSFTAIDFYDADHLNAIGAKKFSKKMDGIIKRLK